MMGELKTKEREGEKETAPYTLVGEMKNIMDDI